MHTLFSVIILIYIYIVKWDQKYLNLHQKYIVKWNQILHAKRCGVDMSYTKFVLPNPVKSLSIG